MFLLFVGRVHVLRVRVSVDVPRDFNVGLIRVENMCIKKSSKSSSTTPFPHSGSLCVSHIVKTRFCFCEFGPYTPLPNHLDQVLWKQITFRQRTRKTNELTQVIHTEAPKQCPATHNGGERMTTHNIVYIKSNLPPPQNKHQTKSACAVPTTTLRPHVHLITTWKRLFHNTYTQSI